MNRKWFDLDAPLLKKSLKTEFGPQSGGAQTRSVTYIMLRRLSYLRCYLHATLMHHITVVRLPDRLPDADRRCSRSRCPGELSAQVSSHLMWLLATWSRFPLVVFSSAGRIHERTVRGSIGVALRTEIWTKAWTSALEHIRLRLVVFWMPSA